VAAGAMLRGMLLRRRLARFAIIPLAFAGMAAVLGGCTPMCPSGGTPVTTQSEINNGAAGATYCITGFHNWTLAPKSGDTIEADAANPSGLDGNNTTANAIVATAPNVTLSGLEIRNYAPGDQDAAIHIADDDTVKATAHTWHLNGLLVHDNRNGTNGDGSGSGDSWSFEGGRFYNNGAVGIGGAMGNSVTIDSVEVDHNNFTNTSYTTANHSCNDEAGGIKWVTNDMTITNSNVHDNACLGVWADLSAERSTVYHNTITNNWNSGVLIEITSTATVAANTVTGNGFHTNGNSTANSCAGFGWGGGILISTSGQTTAAGAGTIDVASNTLSGNCNGVTGVDSFRNEGPCPCELKNVTVHDNSIAGSASNLAGNQTGAWTDDNDNLTTHNLTWTNNTLTAGETNCHTSC
jgi:hypothetical protein